MNEKRDDGELERSWDSWSPESVSLKNPWIIAGLIGVVLIALIAVATFLFGLSRDVATVAVRIIYCGFWGAVFLEQLRSRHWVKATVAVVLLFAGFLEP